MLIRYNENGPAECLPYSNGSPEYQKAIADGFKEFEIIPYKDNVPVGMRIGTKIEIFDDKIVETEILVKDELYIYAQIEKLEQELSDSDYKIIKAYEYSLAGIESDIDIQELHTQRQSLRDQINELRNSLN